MSATRKRWLHRMAVGLAAMPLLSTSCLDISIRTVINSIADSVTPVLDQRLAEQLSDRFGAESKSEES